MQMNNKAVILFADNDADFLNARKEFLEKAGYMVLTATNPKMTRDKLVNGGIDLAIIDIRLEDDNNVYDESGLNIALEVALKIPKIILTNYPSFEAVRKVQKRVGDKSPAAIGFLDKGEDVEELLKIINDSLRLHNVFIVHGHDVGAKDSATLLVRDLDLKPIILMNLPNRGRTIIEKLEDHAQDASYAIVIMTPDDIGYAKRDGKGSIKEMARQNVVFELGYFAGKLGRKNVYLLHQGNTDIFTDYKGVVFIDMEESNWKNKLAQEISDAGLPVDFTSLTRGW